MTFLALLFLLWCNALGAQGSVSGTVMLGEGPDAIPLPQWRVAFYMGAGDAVATGFTDENGHYSLSTDITWAGEPIWRVETDDLCSNDVLEVAFERIPSQTHYEIDLTVCAGIFPPPPPLDCEAYFYAEPAPSPGTSMFIFNFYDLSYGGASPITSWLWDFADGGTSTEQNPSHTFADAGTYPVTLTITSDSCTATITQMVSVWDPTGCDCPTDEYDPVCVETPTGVILTFSQPCLAQCAGYSPDEYFSCNGGGGCGCPEFYAPVCVTLATGDVLTFTNHCFAECEGYGPEDWYDCNNTGCDCPVDLYAPVCVTFDPSIPPLVFQNSCEAECAGFQPGQYQPCDQDCVCPQIYAPVCVVDDAGQIVTFPNACYATCAGYEPSQFIDCNNSCNCDDVYDPVCVATPAGGLILTFNNACEAECAGYGPDIYYPCDGGGCVCPEYYAPVCVLTENGDIIEFVNPCFAQCEGYGPESFVPCDATCDCPQVFEPVCVQDSLAGILHFPNLCFAQCAGFTEDQLVPCDSVCICPAVWDPVCVATPDGSTIMFPNICEAECNGFSEADFVECEPMGCDCPDVYDPVCVVGFAGIITFNNECEALCAGFTPEFFTECNDCVCPDVWDPVCVLTEWGIQTFGNACEAECFGYSAEDFVPCADDCACTQEYAPVCVLTADSLIVTFPNACYAECAGFTPEQFTDCGNCGCTEYYEPVCVVDPATGEIIAEFINPCYAICAGYADFELTHCFPNGECWVDFNYNILSEDGLTIQFEPFFTQEDSTTTWLWHFGDGSTSTERVPTHTYAEGGVYEVSLVITSDECGEVTSGFHICIGDGGGVTGPDCQAFFFFEQPNPDDLLTFQFIDLSFGEGNAWVWSFGDGSTSTEQHPAHTYAQPGNYTVSLTVFAGDCTSTVSIVVTTDVNVWYGDLECRAWFLPIIDPQTNSVFFLNLSSEDAAEFTWDFGDGNTQNSPLAQHQYAEAGIYTVTLTITTVSGCESSFTVTIDLSQGNFTSSPEFFLVNGTDDVPTADVSALRAAPNPSHGPVAISWQAAQADMAQWQLLDMGGRLISSGKIQQGTGSNTLDVDMSAQQAGIYLFRLQTSKGVQTLRLSKL